MQQVYSHTKYLRVAPRKLRLVADLVRNKTVAEAQQQLAFMPHKASGIVKKSLASCVANVAFQYSIDTDTLTISEARVDSGPMLKRFQPRAQGRAHPIHKYTSHLHIGIAVPADAKRTERETTPAAKLAKAPKKATKIDTPAKQTAESKQEKPAAEKKTGKSQKGFTRKIFNRKAV